MEWIVISLAASAVFFLMFWSTFYFDKPDRNSPEEIKKREQHMSDQIDKVCEMPDVEPEVKHLLKSVFEQAKRDHNGS